MSKKPANELPDFEVTKPPEVEAPEVAPDVEVEPTFLPGYRSAMDNPEHPLHHLRDCV